MATSHYTGWTKRYGVKYKNKSIGQCTNNKGDLKCPKCNETHKVVYIDEHVQTGFERWNKYQEFNECASCGYKFCIVMIRKDVVYGI